MGDWNAVTDQAPSHASAAKSDLKQDPKPDAKTEPKPGFTFTDPGCRTEVRLGALLVLAAVFLWLWLGPETSSRLYMVGAPLLLIGIPIQAIQGRKGRPGYPWKIGLAFAIGGALMWPDLRYRESIEAARHFANLLPVQPVAPLLLGAGVWILAWWPYARSTRAPRSAGALA